jgi:hypothetical protein
MNLVFKLDGVICKNENERMLWKHASPLFGVVGFMQWLKKRGHHITIWCQRPNELEIKLMTEEWLKIEQVPYDRLLFDRPTSPIFVDDTPPAAKYYKHYKDNEVISMLYEEWNDEERRKNDRQH